MTNNKTNTEFKMALIKMFKENDLNAEFVKNAKTQLLIEEYSRVMKKCDYDFKMEEQKRRNVVITTLTIDELRKIKDLYMQEIISLYEKDSKSKIECYVK